jgi:hypothetical protein
MIIFIMYFRYQIKYKKNTKVLEKIRTIYTDYCSWYLNNENEDIQNTRQKWQQLVYKYKAIGADIVSSFLILILHLKLSFLLKCKLINFYSITI